MPDATSAAPFLQPGLYPDYLDMQRKQMLAEMLMGAVQRGSPTPQGWDSMRVVPRRGVVQNLAPLVSALMAGKATNTAQQAAQEYFGQLYGGAGGGQSPPPAAPGSPSVPPSPSASTAPTSDASQPAQGSGNPMLLTGSPGTSQALLSLMGPQKYGEGLAARYQPTEFEKQLRAAGIDPNTPLGRQLLQTQVAKAGYVAPTDVRPGGTALDPFTREPFFTGPQNGIQTQWANGQPVAAPVPGAQEATARGEGLDTAAKVSNTPQTFPTAGGGSTAGYPGDVLGTPPAMRGATGTPARGVSASSGVSGAAASQAPAASGAASPWATMPKLYIPQGVGASDLYTQGRLKSAADKDSELSERLGTEAATAEQQLEYSREAGQALPSAETGPLSDWLTRNRSTLKELGVPESLIPDSGSISPTLELNKALKNAALQGARQLYGNRMTQNEVKLQTEEMSPSAGMTSDAIASLMRQNDIRNLYAKQRAADYDRYQQSGGDPHKYESWYSRAFPLTKFATGAQATPAEIAAEMKRRGLQVP